MKKKTQMKKGGPITRKGGSTIGAMSDIGFSGGGGGWINPNKEELMKKAGFKTADEIRRMK